MTCFLCFLWRRTGSMKKGAYIMTGTWMVFNKEFSEDVRSMKFWEPDDRKKYLESIEGVYNDFITHLNK